ncbi:thioesterase [Tirmania nivea]|nr:thioesterase [Tirmania nivea]
MPAPDTAALRARTRRDYPFQLTYRTRWCDNDQYGHINNTVYQQLIDSIVNAYLMQHCGLRPFPSPAAPSTAPPAPAPAQKIGLVVSTHATFFAPTSFPATLLLGLAVTRLGVSSVSYEVGVFDVREREVKAVGGFTHVFVEREARARAGGMEDGVRRGLERIFGPHYSR